MESALDRHGGTLNLLLVVVIGVAAIYLISKGTAIVSSATNAISSGAASLWNSLTLAAPIQVVGNVSLPDGQVVPISSLSWRQDNAGNAYTNVNGGVYQLAARDASGNFTLSAVG